MHEDHLPAQDDLDSALAESFSNGIANSTDLVRAVRESILQHELLQQHNKHHRWETSFKIFPSYRLLYEYCVCPPRY